MKTRPIPRQRLFQCTVCGNKTLAPKWKGRTHPGHIKTMYCYRCGKTTDHVQID